MYIQESKNIRILPVKVIYCLCCAPFFLEWERRCTLHIAFYLKDRSINSILFDKLNILIQFEQGKYSEYKTIRSSSFL